MIKLVALLSGGIDSAVACYLMLRRGIGVEYLHFSIGSRDKAERIARKLKGYGGAERMFVLPHSMLIERIPKNRYTCIYCKRGMLSVAEKLAENLKCEFLLTGDCLGQVASQTVLNLRAEDLAVNIPVLRPLIGFDKEEIVEIAKEIGTYEISIEKGGECRAVPEYPATRVEISEIKAIDLSWLSDFVEEIKI